MTSITYKEKRKEKDIDSEGECSVSNNGSNAGDRKKFLDAAIFNCSGSMLPTKTEFPGMKRLSPAQVNKIFEAAENILRKTYSENTRGSRAAADELLAGGIDTTALNKAFRKFGYGNTELAHQLCVRAQLPTSMKGGKVAYIDTEGTFRPNLIVRIAERFGMEPGAVLDNIIYARAYTYEHQYNLLLGLAAKMSEEPFRLLIVDSIVSLFRVDFTGRGELADRQQKLAEMLSMLIKIAEEFNVAVYMTNQVVADPGGGVFISDPKKPAGGRIVDGPFDKVTCAVFYDVDPYYFVEENFMLGNEQLNEAVEEAHVEGHAGAQDEDQLVLNDGDDSDEDFLNENFLFYYKKPLEVKSRFEMLPQLESFDDLFHNAVQLVTRVETPEQVEARREPDGEEALASFTKYYLSTPMTPRDLSGHYPIQLFYQEGLSEAKYLKYEDAVNMEFNSFNPTMILARRPSKLWYSEVWVD